MLIAYKKNLLHRLKIIRGHLDKVIRMVDDDEYCLDIIQQTGAIQNALKKVDLLLLEHHLKTCIRSTIISNRNVEEKIREIIETFKRK